jgi:hypothetical protein
MLFIENSGNSRENVSPLKGDVLMHDRSVHFRGILVVRGIIEDEFMS